MKHRKLCGCLSEITYVNSIRGLRTKVNRLIICEKHKAELKEESKVKHENIKKTRKNRK